MFSVRCALKWRHAYSRVRSGSLLERGIRSTSTLNAANEQKEGHQSPSRELSSEEAQNLLQKFNDHQAKAARLPLAEDVRTLLQQSIGFGVLSTNSQQFLGFPTGSVVGYHLTEEGKPFFVFSTMSAHTKDILTDSRASLVVMAKDFKGAAEGRVALIGNVFKVTDPVKTGKLRELYLSKHKDAYWIDFGDFSYFLMDSIKAVRFVGGFARAGSVTPDEYFSARPDPLAAFAEPVMKHMNEDHADATQAMIQHYVGVPANDAKIVSLDRLGLTVLAKLPFLQNESAKIRLPFPRPVEDRKAVKEVLVEMTKAAQSGK